MQEKWWALETYLHVHAKYKHLYNKELNFVFWKYLFVLILEQKIILYHSQTKNSELFSLVQPHCKNAIFSWLWEIRKYSYVLFLKLLLLWYFLRRQSMCMSSCLIGLDTTACVCVFDALTAARGISCASTLRISNAAFITMVQHCCQRQFMFYSIKNIYVYSHTFIKA